MSGRFFSLKTLALGSLAFLIAGIMSCQNSSGIGGGLEDTSLGGVAAGAVGGALAGSSSSGTQALHKAPVPKALKLLDWLMPTAYASGSCPTLKTSAGSTCIQTSVNSIQLILDDCYYGASTAKWNAVLSVASLSGASCGVYPTTTHTRQFVSSGGSAGTGTRTAATGTLVTIDNITLNLGNYQGDGFAFVTNGGYATTVTFASNVRTGVSIRERIYSANFDHSFNGQVTVSEATDQRSVSGSITGYDNKKRIKGTSTFDNVIYQDSCCWPTSGSITTALATTSQSDSSGTIYNGKSETLAFTGCGTGTLTAYDGSKTNVSLTHCL